MASWDPDVMLHAKNVLFRFVAMDTWTPEKRFGPLALSNPNADRLWLSWSLY